MRGRWGDDKFQQQRPLQLSNNDEGVHRAPVSGHHLCPVQHLVMGGDGTIVATMDLLIMGGNMTGEEWRDFCGR